MSSMNQLSTKERARIAACLLEGNSIRATCRLTGKSKDAVMKLVVDLGRACARFHHKHVRGLEVQRVQTDELWAFCYAKEATIARSQRLQALEGIGDAWTYTALDPSSKLMIAWHVGRKDGESAMIFMHALASRLRSRIQLSTDGNRNYYIAVPGAFGVNIDYGMLIKLYGDPKPNGRIGTSPLVCVGTTKKALIGNPDMAHVCTSHIERSNLTVRMTSRRYTRSTNAFSKKLENLRLSLAMTFTFYNFCRVHATLKQTPAQAAGLADHAWSLEELVGLLERKD